MNLLKDHPVSIEYATQSGKLIQNFGVIELSSYRWIGFLSKSDIAVELSQELALAKRIDVIVKLLARGDQLPTHKDEAVRLWKQVRDKGCEVRNAIAHGTVGLLFTGDPATEEPQASGVVRLAKWSDTSQLISIAEVKDAVNTTARIAERLNQILDVEEASLGIDRLSVRERLDLIDQIWDTLPDQVGPDEVPDWHLAELARRRAAAETSPGAGRPWRDALARFGAGS